MTAQITAFVNQKGGVGKSTTLFHIARAAILSGKRVLIVDMDPQGSVTTLTAREQPPEGSVGVADVLSRHSPAVIEDVIIPGIWDNLSVAPTVEESLGYVRDELVVSGAGRERKLLEALKPVLEEFDNIYVDCGPSLDLLTINALTAADSAVVVTQTQLLSAKGLKSMLKTVNEIRTSYNPALKIAGIIVNAHEERTISGKQWLEEIEEMHPITFPLIPRSIAVSNSAEAACGLDQWASHNEKSVVLSDMYLDHFRALEGAR
jgi:chromosome partitioning protein